MNYAQTKIMTSDYAQTFFKADEKEKSRDLGELVVQFVSGKLQ